MFSTLNLSITRVDRRPSLTKTPFHDVYFLEVANNEVGKSDIVSAKCELDLKGTAWETAIRNGVRRLQEEGWVVHELGVW